MEFTELEQAALLAISEHYSAEHPSLADQISAAKPVKRENTGGGFFTDLTVDRDAVDALERGSPIGEHFVDIKGMTYPLGLLLFFDGGYVNLLEGYSVGGDDTSKIDFANARFGEVKFEPVTRM